MKKYYEYDAPVLSKLVSVVAIVAICVSMFTSAFCCYKIASMGTVVAPVNSQSGSDVSTDTDNSSTPVETPTSADSSNTATDTPADSGDTTPADNTDTAKPADNGNSSTPAKQDTPATSGGIKGLSTNEEILKKYNEVVTAASNGKLEFKKVEYQELPEQYRNLGSGANAILGVAQGFMTTEKKATSDPQIAKKGEDHAGRWPNANLTDASAIKSAKATQNGDLITIVITLKDERNPEPSKNHGEVAPSKTGCMFTPMAKADIDNTIAGVPGLTVNTFDLNYTDCTTTLVYNAKTNQVQTLTQIMNVDIHADLKLFVAKVNGSARLVNTMKIYDVKY